MARPAREAPSLDSPKGRRRPLLFGRRASQDRFGRFTESIARGMGTPMFVALLAAFSAAWILYNVLAPVAYRIDDPAIGFTALTLVLSLQASFGTPLILLAQNRQDDRDRVQIEADRQRADRNLADTEYLAREVVALRLGIQDLASKDFIRTELRALLAELDSERTGESSQPASAPRSRGSRGDGTRLDEGFSGEDARGSSRVPRA